MSALTLLVEFTLISGANLLRGADLQLALILGLIMPELQLAVILLGPNVAAAYWRATPQLEPIRVKPFGRTATVFARIYLFILVGAAIGIGGVIPPLWLLITVGSRFDDSPVLRSLIDVLMIPTVAVIVWAECRLALLSPRVSRYFIGTTRAIDDWKLRRRNRRSEA